MDKRDIEFDEHLEHFKCEWCQQSYADQHRELIKSEQQKTSQMENLYGTIRSYKLYQQSILAENRDYKKQLEVLEFQLARLRLKKKK